ncbi:MAG: Lrp/AsnC family transcriptional regulator [Ruminococcaceae bacterium]|nr:Lrp/AsnC family transcriptional regulator [Oscillospiraceae bacterium]
MDAIDKKILKLLSENANTTATEIGNTVNLSVPAVNKRISRMQKEGVIDFFTIVTNAKKVNKTVTAFVFIVMKYGDSIASLLEYARKEPDVRECYSVTGEYDYMLKICAKDIESLEEKILSIKKTKGVVKSHTMISLMEHKFMPTVLPDMDEEV